MLKTFTLLIFLVALVSCDKENDSHLMNQSNILGKWNVVEINNIRASDDEVININFDIEGFGGSTATNGYGGRYRIEKKSLLISGVYSTNALEGSYGLSFFGLLTDDEEPSKLKFDFNEDKLKLFISDSQYMLLKR